MEHVEIRFEEALDHALFRVDAHGDASKDARDFDAVAWLGRVHELVVYAETDAVRGLTVWDFVRGFLQSDHLAVCELAPVVDQAHSARLVAHFSRTAQWLGDFSPVDLHRRHVPAA
jgi:hypothetical protein